MRLHLRTYACVYLHLCVREREEEKDRQRDKRERQNEHQNVFALVCVSVHVCAACRYCKLSNAEDNRRLKQTIRYKLSICP